MKSYEKLIQECDAEIRAGRIQGVVRRLGRLNTVRIPAELRLPLAKICRRAGVHTLGLRILSVLVSPQNRKSASQASPEEQAEYAVLLLRIGAVSEATERLEQIDADRVPETRLYRSFGRFLNWEYHEAIGELETYLKTPLAPYAALVGQTNLALANVEIRRHDVALTLLDEVIRQAKEKSHLQLQSTCYALRAQVFLQENQFEKSRKELDLAHDLVLANRTNDNFLLTKCRLLVDALQNNSLERLDDLRRLSYAGHYWEAYREADLYHLKIAPNREKFVHLYFGTPFQRFRDLIHSELGDRPTQAAYVFGPKSAPRFDLRDGSVQGRPLINHGKKCHQLINILLRDFYHPLRVAGLFSALFPGEHFDVESSPSRVRQIIWRTRLWFEEEKIPVGLVEFDGFYSLRIDGAFSFRIPLERSEVEPFSQYLDQLVQLSGDKSFFSAKDAERMLRLPKWKVHKILGLGIKRGCIVRIGDTNRRAMYRIGSRLQQSA